MTHSESSGSVRKSAGRLLLLLLRGGHNDLISGVATNPAAPRGYGWGARDLISHLECRRIRVERRFQIPSGIEEQRKLLLQLLDECSGLFGDWELNRGNGLIRKLRRDLRYLLYASRSGGHWGCTLRARASGDQPAPGPQRGTIVW